MKRTLPLLLILVLVVVFAYLFATKGVISAPTELRPLGKFYLEKCMIGGDFAAGSPEAVTSILWDYRGLDTLFETSVFFLAIIGNLMLFSFKVKEVVREQELTLVVRSVTKIAAVMILAVSASIALHGHLTPGGGFQGGSALAVAPLLVLVAFSRKILETSGLSLKRAIVIRSLGLMGILLTALLPLILGGYIMQNLPIFPKYIADQLTSGSLIFYNIFEYLAVGAGFTAVFLLISIPEKNFVEEEK